MLTLQTRRATNCLAILAMILLSTSAVDFDDIGQMWPWMHMTIQPNDCRHVTARLPSVEGFVTHDDTTHILTRTSPFLPGGLFRHGTCLIELALLKNDASVEEAPAPVLHERDAFKIWGIMRTGVGMLLEEFTDQTGHGGYLELHLSEEYDGPILIEVRENDLVTNDYASYRYREPTRDPSMINIYDVDG